MFEAVTLDQLRTLLAVVEHGSFSAAARKLRRVQSAVSTQMANLEAQLGVALWDRSTKLPQLTQDGRALLVRAKRVLAEMDTLASLATELRGGLEAEVNVCVDALFPTAALVTSCQAFTRRHPALELNVDVQLMSSVADSVERGRATLGIVSPLGVRASLTTHALQASIQMLPVVGPSHPLAAHEGELTTAALTDFVQIVLAERSEVGVPDQAVLSERTWRVADLHTKHALLRAGLGWGNLPEHVIGADLERRQLVRLYPAAWPSHAHTLSFYALHRADRSLGPAHRWLLDELDRACAALDA